MFPSGDSPSGGGPGGKRPFRGFKPPSKVKSKTLALDQHLYMKFGCGDPRGFSLGADPPGGDSEAFPPGIYKLPNGLYGCNYCMVKDMPVASIPEHVAGRKHNACSFIVQTKTIGTMPQKRLRVESNGKVLPASQDHLMSAAVSDDGSKETKMTFTVTNVSANSIFKFLAWGGIMPAQPEDPGVIAFSEGPADVTLRPSSRIELHLVMRPKKEQVIAFSVLFRFEDLTRDNIKVVQMCNVKLNFESEETTKIGASGTHFSKLRHKPRTWRYTRGPFIKGVRLPLQKDRDKLERSRPLYFYDMPKELRLFFNNGMVVDKTFDDHEMQEIAKYQQAVAEAEVTFEKYQHRFAALLYMEEHQTDVDMEFFTMENVPFNSHGHNGLISIEVPGLAENRPSVLRGDQILVQKMFNQKVIEHTEYQGYIHDVQQTRIFVGFSPHLTEGLYKGITFRVRFVHNRLPERLMHRALTMIGPDECDLENVLFPTAETARTEGSLIPDGTELKFFSRAPEPNPEQKRAIQHIVQGSSRPAPYIIFGPPGTGKTFTLVEATKQVLTHISESRVLVCAPSNSAADLVAQKMLEHIQRRQVLRMNAFCRKPSVIPDTIKDVCNLEGGEVQFNNKDHYIKQGVRVFITTLVTAGRLVSAEFGQDFFSHVFIDEVSQSTETEALVALAGLLYFRTDRTDGRQVVMAGDPKQLGPILRSPYADKHGFTISLMERLMKNSLYTRYSQPDTEGLNYDPMMITELIRNYRSHPSIFHVPNQLFYNGDLVACADPMQTDMMLGWEHLPNKQIPVIFHAVIGQDMQEKSSPSFFNPHEVTKVLHYVNVLVNDKSPRGTKIRPTDIGIISPYRRQIQKLQTELRKLGLESMKVGTVEEFQGQENRIIIISTVRSNPSYLSTDVKYGIGFLQNDKRFNVAVTRAKSLLIVIGNPNILRHNNSWHAFIDFCKTKKCIVDPQLIREEDEEFRSLQLSFHNLRLNLDDAEMEEMSALNNDQGVRRDM